MELKWLCNYFPSVEIFCNTLYGFHELGKRIDYDELIREVPPYMQSKIIKINYPALLNSYEMANEIVALRYDKVNLGDISEFFKQLSFMRIDWNLPKDQMIELNAVDNKMVMDGTAYLTLMFHGQSMRILCTRGDFMKIRNGVSYELDTNVRHLEFNISNIILFQVFAKITRFMGKDYVI
uniref:Mediator of RNA polymerase II transcription subunit 20 n=2 Tax=Meloidogyne hapla TaxID=6305 RepID=A0A1I8B7P9_MELHA